MEQIERGGVEFSPPKSMTRSSDMAASVNRSESREIAASDAGVAPIRRRAPTTPSSSRSGRSTSCFSSPLGPVCSTPQKEIPSSPPRDQSKEHIFDNLLSTVLTANPALKVPGPGHVQGSGAEPDTCFDEDGFPIISDTMPKPMEAQNQTGSADYVGDKVLALVPKPRVRKAAAKPPKASKKKAMKSKKKKAMKAKAPKLEEKADGVKAMKAKTPMKAKRQMEDTLPLHTVKVSKTSEEDPRVEVLANTDGATRIHIFTLKKSRCPHFVQVANKVKQYIETTWGVTKFQALEARDSLIQDVNWKP